MIRTATLAAAALMGTMAIAAPASAKEISVRYKDLDLSTPAGKSTLARRLDLAAKDACGFSETQTGSRLPPYSVRQCYNEARARSKETMAAIVDQARKGG